MLLVLGSLFTFKFEKLQIFRLIYFKAILAVILSLFVILFVSKYITPTSLISLIILSLIMFFVYIFFVFILKGFEGEDLNVFRNFLNKFFNKVGKND